MSVILRAVRHCPKAVVVPRGEVAEWSNAPDSKSGIRFRRIEGSNPSLSATSDLPAWLGPRRMHSPTQPTACLPGPLVHRLFGNPQVVLRRWPARRRYTARASTMGRSTLRACAEDSAAITPVQSSAERNEPDGWNNDAAMAEREGFEPSIRDKTYTPLAGERLQPLGHLSRETHDYDARGSRPEKHSRRP